MNRRLTNLIIALVTFTLGATVAWMFVRQPLPAVVQHPEITPEAVVVPKPEANPEVSEIAVTEEPKRTADDVDIQNPYEIALYLNEIQVGDVSDLWQRLGIANSYDGVDGFGTPDAFFSDCHGCEAKTFEFDLDGDARNEVIVRVADNSEQCRYLVFKRSSLFDGKYNLVGHIDHNFGRYEMPEHQFVLSRGKAYMVIRVQAASGSGVASYLGWIVALRNGHLVDLLSFPSDGHEAMLGTWPTREYAGRVLDIEENGRDTKIRLGLTVDYELYGPNNTVTARWTKQAEAVYIKSAGNRDARLVRSASTISQHQIDAEFNIDSLSEDDLVRYNRPQLRAAHWKAPGTR